MSGYRKDLGAWGEAIAARFLEKQGYQIVKRNFYTHHGEIDLIATKGDEFLFTEVKTRTSDKFGWPEEAVNYQKTKHLLKAIKTYLARERIEQFWRLDIISVRIDQNNKTAKVKWFKNVGVDF